MVRKSADIDLIDKYIGKKIQELRLARGLSRQELGDKIGVTHQQCQKYEKGLNRISAGRLMLIATVLEKPIQYFFVDINTDKRAVPLNTDHQRMCIEISRNFMKIKNENHKEAINILVKSLVEQSQPNH
jgi:transcriptional regulator with XRE-family HTH domain